MWGDSCDLSGNPPFCCPGAPSWHLRVVIQCWNPPEFKCHRPMVPWEEVAKELKESRKAQDKGWGPLLNLWCCSVCMCVFMFKSTGYLVQWNSCIHGWLTIGDAQVEVVSDLGWGMCRTTHIPKWLDCNRFKMMARSQWKSNCCSRCEGTLTKWPALSHWILLICTDLSSPQSRPRPSCDKCRKGENYCYWSNSSQQRNHIP